MSFRPLGTNILVRRKEQMTETKGGIIIPDSYRDRCTEGKILEIGDEITKVKIGEEVLFAKYAGTTIENQADADLLVISESNVLGVVE